jgi:acylphosphatase
MKLQIRIVGPKVHDVGYRYHLLGGAMGLRLPGFDANNLMEGNTQLVDVVVEGKDDRIKAYRTFVETSKPPNAVVSNITVSDYDGDVMKIAEYSQILTAMQMLKAIPTMMRIEQNTKLIPKIASNTEAILENTKPISKIASNTEAILENTKPILKIASNTGAILENTKPTPQILEEIKGLREDIQPGFASRFQQVQADVKAIKARLGMS